MSLRATRPGTIPLSSARRIPFLQLSLSPNQHCMYNHCHYRLVSLYVSIDMA